MNELLAIGIGFAAVALILVVWLRDWFFRFCAIGIIVVAYGAGYLQLIVPVRVVMLVLVLAMIAYLLGFKGASTNHRERALLAGLAILSCVGFGIGQATITASETDALFRYTLLYPAIFIAGYLTSKAGKAHLLSHIYVYISLGMALLAVFERLRGSFLVAGGYENADRLVRDGALRSVVFSEHPLVLSVLIAASVPLVPLMFKSFGARCLTYLVLVGGVLSTNSRGALAILAAWFVIRAAMRINFLTPATARIAKFLAFFGAGVAFISIMIGNGMDELSSASAVDASAEYRAALYSFAIRSLTEQPWGWGISGLPEGVYLLPSYFGVLDISKTVDSELALAMFDFGWVGLCGFVGLFFIQIRARSLSNPLGQAALIITVSGLYLALHAWVGLGSVWILMAGLALGRLSPSVPPSESVDGAASPLKQANPAIRRHDLHLPYKTAQEPIEIRRILGPANQ
ncbi:O-antigen ligase family protein [Arthrobacter sp. B2a2-09]|uniref:O-antigen ligase family protein n=1 Tax=Arthrobacter sp. B2a2-09 TaxID=2952822 RepID=UPI0022CDAB78|nr:O-antigen ligase family protein [Arthrobacter sp. B2a2-09]MCZ9882315.1 hypothetical protein [Arthrobacter sp. B2a2-09]